MPDRAKALRADCAPGPGVFVLQDKTQNILITSAFTSLPQIPVFSCCTYGDKLVHAQGRFQNYLYKNFYAAFPLK